VFVDEFVVDCVFKEKSEIIKRMEELENLLTVP